MTSLKRIRVPAEPPESAGAPPIALVDEQAGAAESAREERERAILEVIGTPHPRHRGLPVALRRETARYWRRYVEPLISEHWPAVRGLPFYAKFKIGAQNVYAPAPYTVVVLSARRPRVLRAFNWLCSRLHTPRGVIVAGLQAMLPVFAWLLLRRENKRIALMAAFIALVDEAFDNHLEGSAPEERGDLLRGILGGQVPPPTPSFALVRAIRVALEEGCTDEEREELARAMEGCVAWAEAEVSNMLGHPDPEGLCHRRVGILTGIDGLAWTVRRHVRQAERDWMYDVSEFIQMLDDWVDLEKDAAEGLRTPAHTGVWTLETIEQRFEETRATVGRIVEANGETNPRYVQLARESYAYQVQDLLGMMLKGVAD